MKNKSKKNGNEECPHCEVEDSKSLHPDHQSDLARLKKAIGQLKGIEKMIEERRYCVDILIQFKATDAALAKIESSILKRHIKNCVLDAASDKDKKSMQVKIEELVDLITKRL